jgi:hypothetical protein
MMEKIHGSKEHAKSRYFTVRNFVICKCWDTLNMLGEMCIVEPLVKVPRERPK